MQAHNIETGFNPKCEVKKEKKCNLVFKTIFHTLCMGHHSGIAFYGFYLSYRAMQNEVEDLRKAGQFAFAYGTNWNFAFQAVFLLLAFVHDIYEWQDAQESPRAKKLAYWRDVIFQSMVVPYTLFVSIMFWTLYLIDRELVFPKVYDEILPWWFNHCVHTNITIIILFETVLQARRHPVNQKLELLINSIIAVGYAVVYYSIFFFAHRWLYNVFGVLTWWQVILYQLLIWASSYFFYFIQFPINRLIHGSGEKIVEQKETAEVANGIQKQSNDLAKNFEITSMEKTEIDAPFSDNWSLKYRSLRDKFENSHL